ncbi:DsrE family protein [Allomuricauda sp. F6463D]|uniref:DsrE family protein n=1 Tax=Allomuricauda sp. F6463D TaxID=2926409 RepID=UPI001FF1A898|nr:DsrE family protein [Muricauda sp. F6463D]MCK0160361.1 DsrE family protein [Muricauda sp. F6463D]
MKRIFQTLVIFIAVITLSNQSVFGQAKLDAETVNDLNKKGQYAIGVSDERHFKGALSMYDFLVENGVEISDYEIVVKGKVVSDLVKGSELETYFQKYKNKVRVSVCSVAMKKRDVSADDLFDGLEPVPTYSIRILQLQANDYNTLIY